MRNLQKLTLLIFAYFLFQQCAILPRATFEQTEDVIKKEEKKRGRDFSMIQLMPTEIYCFLDEDYQTLLGLLDNYQFVIHDYSVMISENWTEVEAEINEKNNGIILYVSGLDSTKENPFQKDSIFFSQRKIELIGMKSFTGWGIDVDEDENAEPPVITSIESLKLEIKASGNWQNVSYRYSGRMFIEKNRERSQLPNDDVPFFIHNSKGELVHQTVVGETERTLDLSHLENGLYIFKCKIHGIDFSEKRLKM